MNERHNKYRHDAIIIVGILTHNLIKEKLTQGSSPSAFQDSLINSGKPMGVAGWCQIFDVHNFKVFSNYRRFVKIKLQGLEIVCVKCLKHQSINIVDAPQ